MTARIDRADVLNGLSAATVLEHFGITFRRTGRELRFQTCPTCGQRSRSDAVAISSDTGVWFCHPHGCRGDVLALVAGLAGLDIDRDFYRVLEEAADIAGVVARPGADQEERAARRAALERARRLHEETAAAMRARAESGASAVWNRLDCESEPGLAYLRSRGLEAAAGDVRHGRWSICIPLRGGDGRIVNVVGRRRDGRQPKVRGLAGCGTSGAFGDLRRLPDTHGPITIVEGVADWLSARVLWPDRLVLGAHGAGRIPGVASMAAALAVRAARGILFVPHADDVGRRQVDRGIATAIEAGVPAEDLEVLVIDAPSCDLNDHLRDVRS